MNSLSCVNYQISRSNLKKRATKDILKMSNNEKDLDEMFNLVGMNKPGHQKRFKRQLEELVNQNTLKPNDDSSQSTQDKGK